MIDLRSDTVTRPSPAMREAMARAEVGDDVYGEDPTVGRLEERVAELIGKEAALFVPSGTMGNQIALLCHTRRGDEVIVGEGAHCAFYESRRRRRVVGRAVRDRRARAGSSTPTSSTRRHQADRDYHPRTERSSRSRTRTTAPAGASSRRTTCSRSPRVARAHGLATAPRRRADLERVGRDGQLRGRARRALRHRERLLLEGPRRAGRLRARAGASPSIRAARRFRKMLGGGMRQAGILAAAALYALDHHRERLAEDHAARARHRRGAARRPLPSRVAERRDEHRERRPADRRRGRRRASEGRSACSSARRARSGSAS